MIVKVGFLTFIEPWIKRIILGEFTYFAIKVYCPEKYLLFLLILFLEKSIAKNRACT